VVLETIIKCAIYARVSTDQQGDSIENQISQCHEYISRLGDRYDMANIMVYRDEAVSGYYTSVFDRLEMKQAMQDARNGHFKLLVFKEVSRVGRDKMENPAIIGMFEQYGVRVIAINDNYDSLNKDNITFDILSVLSEQESKKISARVSSARKQKARRGQWGGEPPIGYKVNPQTKKLEMDSEHMEIPQLIFDLYVYKGLGTFKVAEYLNQQGVRTKNGNLWSRETVNKILRNQAYIGSVIYGTRRNKLQREFDETGKMSKKKVQIRIHKGDWQVVEGAHQPLIDKPIFEEAQRILASKSHGRAPRRAYHPLTGILFCGKCGEGMVCQKRISSGKAYRYYICKTYHKYGRSVCDQANINADQVELQIMAILRSKLDLFSSEMFEIKINPDSDIERIRKEMKAKQNKRERLVKDQMDIFNQRELFDIATYKLHMQAIKQQIHRLDNELRRYEHQLQTITSQSETCTSFDTYFEAFKQLHTDDIGSIRVLLQELIKRVVLTEGHLDIAYHYDFSDPRTV
jgi:site-specific DNA recombinase